jgi:hypothetical protein
MKSVLLLIALILTTKLFFAQTPIYTIDQQGSVTTCSAYFYDSGNSGADYDINQNYIMTFHSASITNTLIKVNFSSFAVDASDTLIVYNGSNTSAAIIGKYNNNNLPPSNIIATITFSGDLTFNFKSDASINGAGWFANISCAQPCQAVIALLSTSEMIPAPDTNNIGVCFDTSIDSTYSITFAALADNNAFPQNGILYTQDSSTSQYLWFFGDGTTGTGRVVTHRYPLIKGYNVDLKITDINGCINTNSLGTRVMVSGNPFGHITPIPDLCSQSDTAFVSIGHDASSVINVSNFGAGPGNIQSLDSIVFIPDGPQCSIMCLTGHLTITGFPADSVIHSGDDLLSVCVNMEHSFAGDLGFRIICPNGQSAQLDPNTHAGGAYLGIPMGGVSHDSYDDGCFSINNPYGTGWTYCWSQVYPTHGTMDALSSGGVSPIDSTNTITDSNYVQPVESMDNLGGCPINGTWSIEICDDYGIDNGYLFWWSLEFDTNLLPFNWSYSVPIDTITWAGPFLNHINDSTITIIPDTGGDFLYTVTITDVFGCSYDTTFNVHVVQTPVVNLGPDSTFCSVNGSYVLHAGSGMDSYIWSNGLTDSLFYVSQTGNYSVTVTNTNIANTLQCFDVDSIYIDELFYIDNTVSLSGNTITANATGVNYQWLDCGNNYSPINGEINQSFVFLQNGSYAVLITDGLCSDISSCVTIATGIASSIEQKIAIYPNPIVDELIIDASYNTEIINFEIYNSLGQSVFSGSMTEKTIVNTSGFSKGIYLIKLELKGKVEYGKIVKH